MPLLYDDDILIFVVFCISQIVLFYLDTMKINIARSDLQLFWNR